MANTYNGGFISVSATGTTITTGIGATLVIPNDSSGNKPNFIRVASTTESYIKLGAVATVNDILVQPADAVIIQVPRGVTTLGHIQGTTAGKLNVVALDNS